MPLQGSRLREWRDKRGYTQEELADLLGVSYQQIWRYESGKNDPTGDSLARMAKLLQITTDYLLGLVDDPAGHLEEEDLTPTERRLVNAYRAGRLMDVIGMAVEKSKTDNTSQATPHQEPAINP